MSTAWLEHCRFKLLIIAVMIAATLFAACQKQDERLIIQHGIIGSLWPKEIASFSFLNSPAKKIVYCYSEQDCEQCTISHLKMLKQANHRNVIFQVVGIGANLEFRNKGYKKLFGFDNCGFIVDTDEVILKTYENFETPFLAVLNEQNKVLNCWRADVERLHVSFEKIQSILRE